MRQNNDKPVASGVHETRMDYLRGAKRKATPLRRDFVQWPKGSESRPSVLAKFVTNGDKRGLLAYLFIVAITSAQNEDGWTSTLDSRIWARCFGTTESTSSQAAALSAVAKILNRLQDRQLVRLQRQGRSPVVAVTILREDGTGKDYTHPGAAQGPDEKRDAYIQLPHAFWEKELDKKIEMPALAMLLVAMTELADFALPHERVQEWYGWSADTAQRGFSQLHELGLIEWRDDYRKAPRSALGYTLTRRYRLSSPYTHAQRGNAAGETPKLGKEVTHEQAPQQEG